MNIEIQQGENSRNNAWEFFGSIRDVTNLDPGEEQNEPWAALVDGEVVGMAVVDTFVISPVFVNRIAVDTSYREHGVATRLMQAIIEEYGSVTCRVHKENTESRGLMDKLGFEREGMGRYDELIRYSVNS